MRKTTAYPKLKIACQKWLDGTGFLSDIADCLDANPISLCSAFVWHDLATPHGDPIEGTEFQDIINLFLLINAFYLKSRIK